MTMCEICDEDPLERDLQSMLADASHGLQQAHKLYQEGKLSGEHISWLLDTRDSLAQTLADYEDAEGFNTLTNDFRNYATNAMRCLEQDASALHEAVVVEHTKAKVAA